MDRGRRHRPIGAAAGRRPLSARQGRIHRRHPSGRHARPGVRAQPRRACAHPCACANLPAHEASVFVAADLVGVQPIVAVSGLPGFKPSAQPVLASDKVRHVGEAIAVCVAATPGRSRRPCRGGGGRIRRTAGGGGYARRAAPARRGCTITGTTTSSWRRLLTVAPEHFDRTGADNRAAPFANCAAMHVAAGRPWCGSDVGSQAGATADLHLDADAAHRADRTCRLPGLGAGAHPRCCAGCRRRLRLQGYPAARRKSVRR